MTEIFNFAMFKEAKDFNWKPKDLKHMTPEDFKNFKEEFYRLENILAQKREEYFKDISVIMGKWTIEEFFVFFIDFMNAFLITELEKMWNKTLDEEENHKILKEIFPAYYGQAYDVYINKIFDRYRARE